MYDFLSSYELPRDPGETALYSNLGVGLLGNALARRAGKSYEALVTERICQPLKMDDTRITLNDALRARLAAGANADGEPQANWDLGAFAGAGGIRSTANDMLKYLAAEAGVTHAPFDAALKLTQTRQGAYDANNDIGLNWIIDTRRGVRWHNGQTGGYHSFTAFHPDRHVAVVVLSTTAEATDAIGARLIHHLLGEPIEPLKLRQSITMKPAELEKYVGKYKMSPLATLTVRRERDHLTAELTGQPAARIYPQSPTTFFWKIVDANLTFEMDKAGKVTGLVLHQNGANLPGKRVG
jgi:CubicO group peptidase (beta-lactamase class C family)